LDGVVVIVTADRNEPAGFEIENVPADSACSDVDLVIGFKIAVAAGLIGLQVPE
jgi:hypothetical protein